MSITKGRTLEYIEQEWGTYVERFQRLPKEKQEKRVREQGYERFRDMLAHILAWWDEGMGIILAVAEDRPFERRKYDFDVFNAEAVAKYTDWDETAFLNQFEKTRQKMAADIGSMKEAVFQMIAHPKSSLRGPRALAIVRLAIDVPPQLLHR